MHRGALASLPNLPYGHGPRLRTEAPGRPSEDGMTLTNDALTRGGDTAAALREAAHLAVGEALDAMNTCEWQTADGLLDFAQTMIHDAALLDPVAP